MNLLLQTKQDAETHFGKKATIAPNLLGMVAQGEKAFGFLTGDMTEGFDITVGFFNGKARYIALKKRTGTLWGEGDLRARSCRSASIRTGRSSRARTFLITSRKTARKSSRRLPAGTPRRHYCFAYVPDVPGEVGLLPDKTAVDQKFSFG